jgi:2-keto-4-pentenoate hydratase/2-oxohepta-3-ene-1,7-dioic acid hydratase in catechol pathway
MHIIRYRDPKGAVHFGSRKSDNSVLRCTGDLYTGLRETGEKADVAKLLAPLEPTQILCIGLNYRRHAAESGLQPPEASTRCKIPVIRSKFPSPQQATRWIMNASWPWSSARRAET